MNIYLLVSLCLLGATVADSTWSHYDHDVSSTSRSEAFSSKNAWNVTWSGDKFSFDKVGERLVMDETLMYAVGLSNDKQSLMVINHMLESTAGKKRLVRSIAFSDTATPAKSGNVKSIQTISSVPTLLLNTGAQVLATWQSKTDKSVDAGVCFINIESGEVDWAFKPSVATGGSINHVAMIKIHSTDFYLLLKFQQANSKNYTLVAVKSQQGKELWKREGKEDDLVENLQLAVQYGSFYLLERKANQTYLSRLEAEFGSELFSVKLSNALQELKFDTRITAGQMSTSHFLFTVAHNNNERFAVAFEDSIGTDLWTTKIPIEFKSPSACSPLVTSSDAKKMFTVCWEQSGKNKKAVALDAVTGKVIWVGDVPSKGSDLKLFLSRDGKPLVMDSTGSFSLLDVNTGKSVRKLERNLSYSATALSAIDASGLLFTCGVTGKSGFACDKISF